MNIIIFIFVKWYIYIDEIDYRHNFGACLKIIIINKSRWKISDITSVLKLGANYTFVESNSGYLSSIMSGGHKVIIAIYGLNSFQIIC